MPQPLSAVAFRQGSLILAVALASDEFPTTFTRIPLSPRPWLRPLSVSSLGVHMATDHPAAPTRTAVYTELFDVLAAERNAEHAHRMAEALVRKGRTGARLVGLVDDCRRAVFYSSTGRTLVAYRFDGHGVSESDCDTLRRPLGDAASWVDAHRDDLDWVHPHFRRVLGFDERSEWAYASPNR